MSLQFISPQLATSVDHPPPRAGWIHEVKHDGYRALLVIERRKARAYTRNGYDWTKRYPAITKAAAKLDCRSAIIDAKSSFRTRMAYRISTHSSRRSGGVPKSLIFCAFDLLH